MLTIGSVISGYRIERILGRGGMGTVYLAAHPVLPRSDALKVLSPEMSHEPEFRARFLREADLAATLDHPHIVSVYGRGEAEDGLLWIAMQFVDGSDADTALRAGTMTARRAVHIVSEVAQGLDHAHGRNVVHRDVKPANFLLAGRPGPEERVLLGDFGIARALDDVGLTLTGAVMATLAYAAPEVLSGASLDGRADIYSLGCTLFRLLTGKTPFYDAGAPGAVINAHLTRIPPRATSLAPGLPRAMDDVIATAMAKDPAARFPSARALAAAASDALRGPTGIAVALPPVPAAMVGTSHLLQPATPPPPAAPQIPPPPPPPNASGRAKAVLTTAAGAAVAMLAAAAIAVAVWRNTEPTNDDTTPTMANDRSTTSTVTASPEAAASQLSSILLPAEQIPAGPGGETLTLTEATTWLFKGSDRMTPSDCGPVFFPAESSAYSQAAGYQDVAGQRLRSANEDGGATAFQSVASFLDTESAISFVTDQNKLWRRCAGSTFTLSSLTGDPTRVWTFDQPTESADIVTINTAVEGSTEICQHGMMAVRSVVIDVRQCSQQGPPDTSSLISKIALRVPPA